MTSTGRKQHFSNFIDVQFNGDENKQPLKYEFLHPFNPGMVFTGG
jgi:hypothetical protein